LVDLEKLGVDMHSVSNESEDLVLTQGLQLMRPQRAPAAMSLGVQFGIGIGTGIGTVIGAGIGS
jgi:hypothetical protein